MGVNMREIIWSVCSGDSCLALQGFVRSLRAAGNQNEFVAWSDFDISGATSIPLDNSVKFDPNGMWKFEYLIKLHERYPDAILSYFGAHHYMIYNFAQSFDEFMGTEQCVSFLESNLMGDNLQRNSWNDINVLQFSDAVRSFGNLTNSCYNLNANYFSVRPDFVKDFYQMTKIASEHLRKRNMKINDEMILSVIMNTSMQNKEKYLISNNTDFYGIDISGSFSEKLPDGTEWTSEDYFTGIKSQVNPKLVFCPLNRHSLKNLGRQHLGKRISNNLAGQPVNKGCGACQRSKPLVKEGEQINS